MDENEIRAFELELDLWDLRRSWRMTRVLEDYYITTIRSLRTLSNTYRRPIQGGEARLMPDTQLRLELKRSDD